MKCGHKQEHNREEVLVEGHPNALVAVRVAVRVGLALQEGTSEPLAFCR